VHGLALRHGHRWVRADGKGESTSRRIGRQRKDTFNCRPVHSDALPSLNELIRKQNQTRIRMLQSALDIFEEEQAEILMQINDRTIDDNDNDEDMEEL
jgi:hypothetical protein